MDRELFLMLIVTMVGFFLAVYALFLFAVYFISWLSWLTSGKGHRPSFSLLLDRKFTISLIATGIVSGVLMYLGVLSPRIPIELTSISEIAKVEWPGEIDVRDTGSIRLTLFRTPDDTYQPLIEIPSNNSMVRKVIPIGTPQALLKDAFGPGYHVLANASVSGEGFDFSTTSNPTQPFSESNLYWTWTVAPKRPGKHFIQANISAIWAPGDTYPITNTTIISGETISRTIWVHSLFVDVTEPFFRWGSYTLGEILGGLFGVGLLVLQPHLGRLSEMGIE